MKIMALSFVAIASVIALSGVARASQSQDFNQGLKEELQDVEQLYPRRPKKLQGEISKGIKIEVKKVKAAEIQAADDEAPAQTQAQAPAPAPTSNTQIQPIYIVQPANSAPAQVQPATNVEAAPVKESRIDQLRKQREEVEHQTEDKMMQRLEDDRLLSEKERADKILNPLSASPSPSPSPAAQQSQAATQPEVVTPAAPLLPPPTVVIKPEPEPVPVVSTKVEAAPTPAPQEDESRFTVGGLAGLGSYPTVDNVSGAYAAGVTLGVQFAERMGVEAAAVFSTYDIKNLAGCMMCGQSLVKTLDQMNFTGAFTYHVLPGRVSPVLGALAGFTRRTYSDRANYGYSYGSGNSGSSAFDGGLLVGIDVSATKKLIVGADVRYMMNLSYRTDDPMAYWGPVFGSPIEGLNYYIASINLKLAL